MQSSGFFERHEIWHKGRLIKNRLEIRCDDCEWKIEVGGLIPE